MEIATIQGETRTAVGRNANEQLRRRGMIPAVIYGHGEDPEMVALSLHDMKLALQHLAHLIKLKVNGNETEYLIKEVQYDHLQATPIHVDLMRFNVTERVEVKVPLEFKGTPAGVNDGGALVHVLNELDVECLVHEIPTSIRVKIDHLKINDSLLVRDVTVPPNVTVLNDPEEGVVSVQPPRVHADVAEEEVAAEEGAAAEPEVIGRGKEEEEAGAGEES